MGDFVSYKQKHKAIFYPGSGPRRVIPYVLLVCIAFDGVITIGEIALARKAKAIENYGYGCFWGESRWLPLLALYRWPGLKIQPVSKYN